MTLIMRSNIFPPALFVAASLAKCVYGQTFSTPLDSQDFTLQGASVACNTSLNAAVACPAYVLSYPNSGMRYQTDSLTQLCSTACSASIATFRASVVSNCAGFVYTDWSTGVTYPSTFNVDYLSFGRALNCLQDSAGDWCSGSLNTTTASQISSHINIRARHEHQHRHKHRDYDDVPIENELSNVLADRTIEMRQTLNITDACSECMLKSQQMRLNSPYGYDDSFASNYNSLTSSCSQTQYPYTVPTSAALNGTGTIPITPAPSATCAGTTVTISPGQSCHDISSQNRISTQYLLEANGLVGNCADFPTSGSLCLPDNMRCNVYRVVTNDTCDGVAAAYNITKVQLLTWNTFINSLCTNIDQSVGYDICVSNPRGPFQLATITGAPLPVTTATTAVPVPSNIGPEVNKDCGLYYYVNDDDNCNLVVQKYSLSMSDFMFLNPSINDNCTNLWANTSYCVLPVGNINTYNGYPGALPTVSWGPAIPWSSLPDTTIAPDPIPTTTSLPLANGTRLDCIQYQDCPSQLTWGCADVASYYNVATDDLLLWNPSLDGLSPCIFSSGVRYCVQLSEDDGSSDDTTGDQPQWPPVPPNTTPNVTGYCQAWYTTQPGDDCELVLGIAHITLAHLYQWNPAVGPTCGGLWMNTSYCVSGPGYNGTDDVWPTYVSTSINPTPTTTTPAGGAPGPTRPGQAPNCDKWAMITSANTCANVLSAAGLTITQFVAMNPSVGSNCANAWANYAYCIHVPGGASTPSTVPPSSTTVAPAAPPGPTRPGQVANCDKWAVITSTNTCANVLTAAGLTIAQFYAMNPSVGANCANAWASYAYCIHVAGHKARSIGPKAARERVNWPPGPTRDGIDIDCNQWILAERDDDCGQLATASNILLTDFYGWNPALHEDCSKLSPGFAYCVGRSLNVKS